MLQSNAHFFNQCSVVLSEENAEARNCESLDYSQNSFCASLFYTVL